MKTIHILQIVDKSTSMHPYQSRTIEGINGNINTLKKEVDNDTEIIVTQLQFSSGGNYWSKQDDPQRLEQDFVFKRVGQKVQDIQDMVAADYDPRGSTPLLDAVGYGIEKVKQFHGDKLGDENLKILVTIYTDGEENSSVKWTRVEIKKMIEHFEADGKWTFTFVGCGSFDNVAATSGTLGMKACNTVAYCDSDFGRAEANAKISTSYMSYARSVKSNTADDDLFKVKVEVTKK
jgi:hypothetical protein